MDYIDAFHRLQHYCHQEGYKGWDPYDGLNSRIFQWIPGIRHSAFCRLAMIQSFKRLPCNLRRWAMVPKEYNPKGIALFLKGYCFLHQIVAAHPEAQHTFGNIKLIEEQINQLAQLLISLQSKGNYHGACWGYNFDWQSRRQFLFPKYTPTVVVTKFCADALYQAYEITHQKAYLDIALSTAQFVLHDLHRTLCQQGFLFSYSPLNGHNTVINASLLGTHVLSLAFRYTGEKSFYEAARTSAVACCAAQRPNGAWPYGNQPFQQWVDSFHTGYNLEALYAYFACTHDSSFVACFEHGFNYYIKHFFDKDGRPKYYDNCTLPIDIHSPAQLMMTLEATHRFNEVGNVPQRVMDWTLTHMQDKKGYFYYQKKKFLSSHIPYMRWNNAFMFCAMCCFLKEKYATS